MMPRFAWDWSQWLFGISFAWFMREFDYEVDIYLGPLLIIIPTWRVNEVNIRLEQ